MADADEWVSWNQAAHIVGCPVPTIDWHTRTGRIEKRPFQGSRPTLRRSSVDAFARWWSERERLRAERRARPRTAGPSPRKRRRPRPGSSSPPGWMSSREAAEALGVSPGHVGWLLRQGRLTGQLVGHRRWITTDSVEALVAHRRRESGWISAAEAASIVGCSPGTLLREATRGTIVQRQVARQHPSLAKESVLAFREVWAVRQKSQHREPARPASAAPNDEHRWLTTAQTARRLGLSVSRVNQLAHLDLLPNVSRGARRWYREDHLTLYLNARRALAGASNAQQD